MTPERRKVYSSHILPFPPTACNYKKQSIELEETRRPGQTGIYRNAWNGSLYDFTDERIRKNAVELFEAGLQVSANKPCLGCRPRSLHVLSTYASDYKWQTYAEVDVRRRSLGSTLEFMSQEIMGIGEAVLNVGIWGCNSPEWQIIDLACQAYGKISTVLDELWDSDIVEYVCNQVELSLIFLTLQHLPTILKLSPKLRYLRGVILIEAVSPETYPIAKGWANSCNLKFFTMSELEKLGRENIRSPIMPTDAQICTICYTSGTTGLPKPTILTHGQIALAVSASEWGLPYKEPGITLSSLPLSNVHQRLNDLVMLNCGGAIGYVQGSLMDLLEDMQNLRPTVWTTIPPILNRLYHTLYGNTSGIKGDIFRKAVAEKLLMFQSTKDLIHPFWDRIALSNARQLFGGNLQTIILGGSPSNPEITQLMRVILSCPIYEGTCMCQNPLRDKNSLTTHRYRRFGITETFGPIFRTLSHDPDGAGTIGIPLPHMEAKLIDVPELSLTSQDQPRPTGELCCRSVARFLGYYKDYPNTCLTLDKEGWIHTGDIAEVDSHGRFRIIGHKANIIKLSSGSHVALEQLEGIYGATTGIRQIFVHGDERRDYLVALVVPTVKYLCQLGEKLGGEVIPPTDRRSLGIIVRDKQIKALIHEELNKQANRNGLPEYKKLRNIHVMLSMFDSGCLDGFETSVSPTRVTRRQIYVVYRNILDEL